MISKSQSLVLQDLRLAKASFELARSRNAQEKMALINGALRLAQAGYVSFIKDLCRVGNISSEFNDFAGVEQALRLACGGPSQDESELDHLLGRELELLTDNSSPEAFFSAATATLAKTLSESQKSDGALNLVSDSLISSTNRSFPHWTKLGLDACLEQLRGLTDRIQHYYEHADEY